MCYQSEQDLKSWWLLVHVCACGRGETRAVMQCHGHAETMNKIKGLETETRGAAQESVTGFAEARMLTKIGAKVLAKFLNEEILSRYGAIEHTQRDLTVRNSGGPLVFSSDDLVSIILKCTL